MKKPFDNFYIRNLLILIALFVSVYLICGAFFVTAGAPERVVRAQAEEAIACDTAMTSEETEKSDKKDNEVKPKKTGEPYYVTVNCRMNTVTVYARDDDGEFTVPVKAMVCSTGSETPRGKFNISNMGKWNWLDLVGGVYGQYCTQIKGNYLFHSVPYTVRYDKGSLQPGEYDKLGTTCSHGCIRLTVADAKWIYDNKSDIAGVELYDSSTAGPLGKPSAQKINGTDNSGWDPTDPEPDNPWHEAKISVGNYEDLNEQKATEQAKGPEPAVPTATPEITNSPE